MVGMTVFEGRTSVRENDTCEGSALTLKSSPEMKSKIALSRAAALLEPVPNKLLADELLVSLASPLASTAAALRASNLANRLASSAGMPPSGRDRLLLLSDAPGRALATSTSRVMRPMLPGESTVNAVLPDNHVLELTGIAVEARMPTEASSRTLDMVAHHAEVQHVRHRDAQECQRTQALMPKYQKLVKYLA